ncbi:cyclic GMP-AMP synthase isoform X1 [Pteropus vampyrus]|uniref:Cyclic GMP-AMP synthase n=1 Tax=Pteropus vampyrus TaxID=132908 RepID=A0A6P3RF05_PTEVA|nr:cyclic GMP-AMP synthase isoform X1 [Pteropus vampyrus]
MDPQRGKATRTAPKARACAPKASAPSAKGAARKPNESPVVPAAARPNAQRRGSTRSSGSQQKESAPGPQERPPARARCAGAKKAPLSAEDAVDGQEGLAEGPLPPAAMRPPLSRDGSRRTGGARSAPGRRPRPAPAVLHGPDPLVAARILGGKEAPPGTWKLQAVLEKLRLRRQEISAAAEVVNRVVDHLLRRVQSFESEFKDVTLLRAGSYYEQVKISAPNEFDVMFKLSLPRIELQEYGDSGAHYFVKFKRNPKGNPLRQFLEGEFLSASKMLLKFREIIKGEIKNIKDTDIKMERKKKGSPAVTLRITKPKVISVDVILALEAKANWPPSTQEGLPISNWLGRKVRRSLRQEPFYLVAKHAKEGNDFQEETWRLSFSHTEKYILKNHGQSKTCCEAEGVKCCRKDCLKLMKYLLEELKNKFGNQRCLNEFCSYHVKTAFLHICTQQPDDRQWQVKDLEHCFDHCVAYFLEYLKTEHLKHFFIPGVNLFSPDQIKKMSKAFLSKEIEYQRLKGFPLFQ